MDGDRPSSAGVAEAGTRFTPITTDPGKSRACWKTQGSRAVGDRTVRHIEHDDGMGRLVNAVTDTPLPPAARGVLASVFIAKRVADAIRVVKERADDELGDRRGDLLG